MKNYKRIKDPYANFKKLDKALTKCLQEGWLGIPAMPTWKMYTGTYPKHGIQYEKLLETVVKWETDPFRRLLIECWKEVRRRINLDNPSAAHLANLFK